MRKNKATQLNKGVHILAYHDYQARLSQRGYSILVFAEKFQGMQMMFSTRVSINVKQKPVYCTQPKILIPKENGISILRRQMVMKPRTKLLTQQIMPITWFYNFLIRFTKSSYPHCLSFQFSKFRKLKTTGKQQQISEKSNLNFFIYLVCIQNCTTVMTRSLDNLLQEF